MSFRPFNNLKGLRRVLRPHGCPPLSPLPTHHSPLLSFASADYLVRPRTACLPGWPAKLALWPAELQHVYRNYGCVCSVKCSVRLWGVTDCRSSDRALVKNSSKTILRLFANIHIFIAYFRGQANNGAELIATNFCCILLRANINGCYSTEMHFHSILSRAN